VARTPGFPIPPKPPDYHHCPAFYCKPPPSLSQVLFQGLAPNRQHTSQLLESVSSKQPTFLSEEKWQRFRNFHPRLLPWQPALITDDTTEPRTATGPRHYLDFIFDHLIIVSNLTAEFANGLTRNVSSNEDNTSRPMRRSMSSAISLQRIQAESLAALERLEIVLAQMMTNIGGALVNTTSHSTQKGPCWGKPLEYNLAGLCRTAAVTLRLLVCHLIEEQQQEQQQQQQQKKNNNNLLIPRKYRRTTTTRPTAAKGAPC